MARSGRKERMAIHLWGIHERGQFGAQATAPAPHVAWRGQLPMVRELWRAISLAAWRLADDHFAEEVRYEKMYCVKCTLRHVDSGEFATRKHHTHRCLGCGHEWRVVPYTFGIADAAEAAPTIDPDQLALPFSDSASSTNSPA